MQTNCKYTIINLTVPHIVDYGEDHDSGNAANRKADDIRQSGMWQRRLAKLTVDIHN